MKKLSRNVFFGLAVRMIGFGIGVGVFFPFFSVFFGIDKKIAFSFLFFLSCIVAGIMVGIVNFWLTKQTVGKKLKVMTQKMSHVKDLIESFEMQKGDGECSKEECMIEEDSEDEFGICADAFNTLVSTLSFTLKHQSQHRVFIETLTKNLELSSLSEFALKSLLKYTGANGGAILVETEGKLINAASFGIKNPMALTKNPILLETLKTGESYRLDLPDNIILDGIIADFRPKQIVVEPIKFSNVTSGIVILASKQDMDKDFLDQIDIFVYDLSLVLNNSLQHEQMQKLAALDPLTGVYNRRFGLSRLNEEFSRASRTNMSLGVMMMDIDKFKLINDTYGHIAGDRYLKNIVAVSIPILRNGDIFIRYGGEEFLVILPGTSKENVFKIAERIRYAVSQTKIVYGEAEVKTTISIGVDAIPETTLDNPTQLITNADSALYMAKNSGRNRTVVFEESKK